MDSSVVLFVIISPLCGSIYLSITLISYAVDVIGGWALPDHGRSAMEKQIIALEQRVEKLETIVSVDRYKAEQEKTRRQNEKDRVAADRLTVLVKKDGDLIVLAEFIKDPIKFRNLVKKGIIEKIRGTWVVHPGIAERQGHLVLKVN